MNKEFEQWVNTECLTDVEITGARAAYYHLQQNPHLLKEDGESMPAPMTEKLTTKEAIEEAADELVLLSGGQLDRTPIISIAARVLKDMQEENGRNNSQDLRQEDKEDCNCYYTKFCKAPEHLKTGERCRDEKENADYKDAREQLSPAKTTPTDPDLAKYTTSNILDKNAENVKDSWKELAGEILKKYLLPLAENEEYNYKDWEDLKTYPEYTACLAALTEMAEIAYERGREAKYDFPHDRYNEVINELQNDKIAMEQQLAEKEKEVQKWKNQKQAKWSDEKAREVFIKKQCVIDYWKRKNAENVKHYHNQLAKFNALQAENAKLRGEITDLQMALGNI